MRCSSVFFFRRHAIDRFRGVYPAAEGKKRSITVRDCERLEMVIPNREGDAVTTLSLTLLLGY